MTVAEVVMQKLRELSPERQREVLDFVEFLEAKAPSVSQARTQSGRVSALELAGELVGSVEGGPGDLSTNREHIKDYGA